MSIKRIYKTMLPFFWSVLSVWMVATGAKATEAPIPMLKTVTGRVISEINQNRASLKKEPQKLYQLIDALILPHVDFAEMGRWVAGRSAWKAADGATQQAFIQEFKQLLVRTYGNSLLEYAGSDLEFLPLRGNLEGKTRIQAYSLLKEQGKSPMHVDYNLILSAGEWRVYDIIIEGVSLIQGYRAQFAEEAQRAGLAGVTQKIRQHNQG